MKIIVENLAINKRQTLQIALALLPGILASIWSENAHYLLASFFAVCAIIPFGSAHCSKNATYIFALVIIVYSLLINILIEHWFMLYCSLAGPSFLFAIYEKQNKALKTMTSWWIIGVVYGGFHLHHSATALTFLEYLSMGLLTLIGLSLALFKQTTHDFTIPPFHFDKKDIRYYSKYPLAFFITIALLNLLNIQEGEWLIWSCFSVLSLDFDKAKSKYQQRLIGVAFGVSLGLVAIQMLPFYPFVKFIYLIGILLSLRLFYSYLYSFAVRCFFIVLYAGSHYHQIGYARLIDIALGGAIGILLSYFLRNREAV